ncbi:MAG: hypothetical protein MUC96_12275 [Myxococcaceae bacterium]|nr:hypothetical protein [Myxococcaceae bacterium]
MSAPPPRFTCEVAADVRPQSGIPLKAGVQDHIGAQWRDVKRFAMTRASPMAHSVDPGAPPRITPAATR